MAETSSSSPRKRPRDDGDAMEQRNSPKVLNDGMPKMS